MTGSRCSLGLWCENQLQSQLLSDYYLGASPSEDRKHLDHPSLDQKPSVIPGRMHQRKNRLVSASSTQLFPTSELSKWLIAKATFADSEQKKSGLSEKISEQLTKKGQQNSGSPAKCSAAPTGVTAMMFLMSHTGCSSDN